MEDFNDVYSNTEETGKKTTRRSRAKKTTIEAPVVEAASESTEAPETPSTDEKSKD